MQQHKQYIAPFTTVFQLAPHERLMEDFPMAGSPSHGQVGG